MFDLGFVMPYFTDSSIPVKIIHGSWKSEDRLRQRLEQQKLKYKNVDLVCAYMPEPFGTHHSKMMVLFAEDADGEHKAQVVIHTANMIPFTNPDLANFVIFFYFPHGHVKSLLQVQPVPIYILFHFL
jgi:tyrosyl-DNA phosphodiesterase-1